jgi:hypothetical protein
VTAAARLQPYVPWASLLAAVLAVALWPVGNTFPSIWLAVAAIALGIGGFLVARQTRLRRHWLASGAGLLLGTLVAAFWGLVMYVVWSISQGAPL